MYPCPLHKGGTPSLCIRENQNTGLTYFDCTNPACRFYGDAIALTAAVKHIPISDAVELFCPGGSMANGLKEPLLDAEAIAYREGRTAQSRIQAYLSQCQQMVRQTPDKAKLRIGLSLNNLRVLPQELGLLIHGTDIPTPFHEFNKAKYQRTNHIVYPFTYNGEVTHVQVQDTASTLTKSTVTIIRSDIGVFMERFDEPPTQLVATFDPRSAALIYGNCTAETSKKPAVVAIAGFPLPESLNTVTRIDLLSTADHPLTLTDALQTIAVGDYVAGTVTQPEIRVWWSSKPAEQITAEHVRLRVEPGITSSLNTWALREMERLMANGGTEDVYKALNAAALPDDIRMGLLIIARQKELSQGLIDLLRTAPTASTSRVILGNGKLLRRTATQLKAVAKNGDEITLCNTGLIVDRKIRTYTGEEVLICTITVPDADIPPLSITLPEASWSKASSIQKIIMRGFANRNQTPYIAYYDVPGYDWQDILCKLASQCELYHEVRELGISDASELHLPNFVLRIASKTVERQKQIFTLPPNALQVYNGIPGTLALSACEPYRNLLTHCDNLYVAAFTCGLMHVIYQMTYEFHRKGHGKNRVPKHLLYVETETGIWQSVFKQLVSFFSDNDYVPILDYSHPEETLEEYRQLGTLPLLTRIPAFRGDRFPKTILGSPISLIGLVDSATASVPEQYIESTFVTPSSAKPEKTCVIDPVDLNELRQAFTGFILEYITRTHTDSVYAVGQTPAHLAYYAACEMLKVAPSPLMQKIARVHFPGADMRGVSTFFDLLHRVLNLVNRKSPICILRGTPPKDASFTGRGQHIFIMDEHVVISHAVIEVLNRDGCITSHFNKDQLTQELKERNLLIDCPKWLMIDTNRCWVLKRDVWDAQVVRPPIWLPQTVTADNVIQLKRIA